MANGRIEEGFFGYNFNLLFIEDWRDPRLPGAVAGLSPGHLRIPGGTIADYWDWTRGGIVAGTPAQNGLTEIPYSDAQRALSGATLNAIAPVFAGSGAEATFVMNIVTSTLSAELARLDEARAAGIQVTQVEIGNEQYFNLADYVSRFPRPADYAATALAWTQAVKARFPTVEVGVIGWIDAERAAANGDARALAWNQALIDSGVLAVADAITFHPYVAPRETRATLQRTAAEAEAELAYHFDFTRGQLGQSGFAGLPSGLEFWITEYSTAELSGLPTVGASWTQALSNLGRAMIYAADPRVDSVTSHALFGQTQWQAMVSPAQPRAADHDQGGASVAADVYTLTANGYALDLFADFIGVGGRVWSFDPTPANAADPALGLRIARDDGTNAVLAVNGAAAAATLAADGAARTIAVAGGDPWDSVFRPSQLAAASVTAAPNAGVALAPFSAALVEIESQAGTAGRDTLRAYAGDDSLNGGGELDAIVYAAARAAATVTQTAGVITVTLPGEGVDRLAAIERLMFSDGVLAFDTAGAAGQAYRLYQAAFARTPDAPGLGYWVGLLDAGRIDLARTAESFAGSPEFQSRYGPLSDTAFVQQAYRNVLGREGEAAGVAFWSGELARGVTRGVVLAGFSESAENVALVAPSIAEGIWFV